MAKIGLRVIEGSQALLRNQKKKRKNKKERKRRNRKKRMRRMEIIREYRMKNKKISKQINMWL